MRTADPPVGQQREPEKGICSAQQQIQTEGPRRTARRGPLLGDAARQARESEEQEPRVGAMAVEASRVAQRRVHYSLR